MIKISDVKINIPKYVKLIIDTLENSGYEAYIVGGCVRDALLGKEPSDYDITTSATPQAVKKLFKRTIDTGIKHGTVTVLFYENDKPKTYEVTTFRIDGEYDDARHPKNVVFVDNLKEDLLRRDFTVNAMAYNDKRGLIDEFGGIIDIDRKLIRAVGNPIERFSEDALRLLRAIRFSAKLGFSIDEETENAIPILASNLSLVSKERIQVELTKTITSRHPEYVEKVFKLGLARYISDGLELIDLGRFDKELPVHLAYACLFYNTETALAIKYLKNIKFDNSNILKIDMMLSVRDIYKSLLESYNNKDADKISIGIKELINYLGYDLTYDFIRLISINEEKQEFNSYLKSFVDELKLDNCPIFVKDLQIDGNDLIDIGFNGQEIGIALKYLLKIVHKNRMFNNKMILQELAKKAYSMVKE